MPQLENILGAFTLMIADRLKERAVKSSHCSEGGVIALNQIGSRERPTIEDLRASLHVDTHSAATRVVARLEADELVTKTKSDEDSRFVQLALTNKGEAVRNAVLRERELLLEETLAPLDREERQVFEELLKKIIGNLVFDRQDCERTCRLCDESLCVHAACPIQMSS